MVRLRDKDTGADLGEINADELQFLVDGLEEESADDTNYYILRDELEVWREGGGAPIRLVEMLEAAIGSRPGIEVEWLEE
jgi:hypothetical protein